MKSFFIKICCCCLLVSMFFAELQPTAGSENISVKFTDGTSLRELAGRYLNHPDRWELILRYNGFSRLSDLSHGDILKIPVSEYRQVSEKLKTVRERCTRAALNGAKILSPRLLKEAWTSERSARSLMNRGDLQQAVKTAEYAALCAQEALNEALEKRTRSVSAVLYRKQGTVQNRRQARRIWEDAEIGQEFVEKEYVRTLKKSYGEIYFVNDQHVDLKENSLVVIGEIRTDLLDKTAAASVKVLKGDILVYLDSLSQKEQFAVELPGVQTEIRSRHFRTGRDLKRTARIANYDGEIDVEAAGVSVKLKKNEGTRIADRHGPTPPVSLLPPPRIIKPVMDSTSSETDVGIELLAVDGAMSYMVEISGSISFSPILTTAAVTSPSLTWKAPGNGIYYLRTISIDKNGLAGPSSAPYTVYVNTDVSELFLAVHSPNDGMIFFSDRAAVKGAAAAGSAVSINDAEIPVGPNGEFTHYVSLKKGSNEIRITARKTGKKSASLVRRVFYRPNETLIKIDAEGPIYSRQRNVLLTGSIAPGTLVEINGTPVQLAGRFTHLLDLPEGDHLIHFKAHQPPDRIQEIDLAVHIDLTPPQLTLNSGPAYTGNETGMLAGHVSEEASLYLDGEPVPVSAEGNFTVSVKLADGRNDFRLLAEDPAGNRTHLTRTLWRDSLPPVIRHIDVSPARIQSGGIVMVNIRAEDDGSGLARTGQFSILIAGNSLKGILTLEKDGSAYEGSLFVPPEISGPVTVSRLVIQDLLGNRKAAAYNPADGKISEIAVP